MTIYPSLFTKKSVFALALIFGAATAEATVNLSNVPLQTGSTLAPNVLFMLDDSGSMKWGFMPDSLADRLVVSDGWILGKCDAVVDFAGVENVCAFTLEKRKYLTSFEVNKSYFSPDQPYLPPVKADGSSYPSASFSNAPINGYDSSSGTVNLMLDYYALMDDFYYGGEDADGNLRDGFTVSPNAKKGQAFYHKISTDCVDKFDDSCYEIVYIGADLQQKFANWFSYYRTRFMASKAGIGKAFQQQNDGMRLGYGTINSATVVSQGVRKMDSTHKGNFLTWLYNREPSGSTPLRKALDAAGQYFTEDEAWYDTPETKSGGMQTCRQNFSILMTDGYWNGDTPEKIDNQDGTAGKPIKRTDGTFYTYEPRGPFEDKYFDTLADVAMKYWKTDLRPLMENNVPLPDGDENAAFWQHMVTYGVGLGVSGKENAKDAFAAVESKATINWGDPFTVAEAKIDDLLHAAVNSGGGFFSAADSDTFSKQLGGILSIINARVASASNLVGATSSLETEKQIFQGRFFSGDWTGDLWAYSVDDSSKPSWKASEKLDALDWESRKIVYSTSASLAKGADFKPSVDGLTDLQVNYIRGERDNELKNDGGIFRNRTSVLGDIAHSTPFYVGATENKFYERFSEWEATERTSYAAFLATNKEREKAVYVGSNSGMLHAFNADDGEELFAYIPHEMLAKLPNITSKDYLHEYYVDGSVVVADAYVSGDWKSVLVGTTGRGGKNVFALDVTDPESFDAESVLWEKSIPELGNYTGKPVIAKLRDDKWYAILGSGVNSSNLGASLILLPLDGGTHKVITAATGTALASNGLFQPEGWDIDNSGRIGRVFAGDYQGNVWDFDLSDKSPSNWVVAHSNKPLFTAKDKDGNSQSITGGISVSLDAKTGNLWLFFGTGKYLEKDDPVSTATQTWYGLITPVADDAKGKGKGDGLVDETGPITGRSQLAKRTLTNVGNARVVEDTENLSGKRGWYIDLIDSGERITSTPQVIGTTLVINTIVPKADQCSSEGYGYVMAIDPYEGTRLKRNFFDVDGSKVIDDGDLVTSGGQKVPASGLKFKSAPGEPIFYKDTMKVGLEDASIIDVIVDTETKIGRVSWREVIN